MSRAVLSIGSNLGDRAANLQLAVGRFRPWLVSVSPVYETAPWGPVPQGDFLNAVLVAVDPAAEPTDWLARARAAERQAGRVRDQRWGPRTLDVDVVAVDDVHSDDPALQLPHPGARERAFVLIPWLAADPDARLADRPVPEWIDALSVDEVAGVRRLPEVVLQ